MIAYIATYASLASIIALAVYTTIRRARSRNLDAVLYRARMLIYAFVGIAILHLFFVIGSQGLPMP